MKFATLHLSSSTLMGIPRASGLSYMHTFAYCCVNISKATDTFDPARFLTVDGDLYYTAVVYNPPYEVPKTAQYETA